MLFLANLKECDYTWVMCDSVMSTVSIPDGSPRHNTLSNYFTSDPALPKNHHPTTSNTPKSKPPSAVSYPSLKASEEKQVWSLTQFFLLTFQNQGLVVKSAFSTNTDLTP